MHVHTCTHALAGALAHACVRACVCPRACARACAYVCARATPHSRHCDYNYNCRCRFACHSARRQVVGYPAGRRHRFARHARQSLVTLMWHVYSTRHSRNFFRTLATSAADAHPPAPLTPPTAGVRLRLAGSRRANCGSDTHKKWLINVNFFFFHLTTLHNQRIMRGVFSNSISNVSTIQ